MTRISLGSLLALVIIASPGAAAPPAETLKTLDQSVSRRQPEAVLAALSELRGQLLAARAQSPAQAACLRSAEGRAWAFERAAKAKPADWAALETELDGLWSAAERCGISSASLAAGDAAWALEKAARKVALLRAAPRGKACSGPAAPGISALLGEVSAGVYGPAEMERLHEAVGGDLVQFAQKEAFASGEPGACERWSAVDKAFVVKTEAAARCGTFECRQKFHTNSLTKAFLIRGPELESSCRKHIAGYSPILKEADAEKVCAIIAADIERPERVCDRLIPRYMSAGKREACVSEFQRNLSYADERSCERLESWEGGWLERCRDLTAFQKAHAAGRAELCGDREVCWLFMGRWDEKYRLASEAAISGRWCETLSGLARLRRDEASALLAGAESALRRSASTPANDALRAKAVRLRQDLGRSSDRLTSRSAVLGDDL